MTRPKTQEWASGKRKPIPEFRPKRPRRKLRLRKPGLATTMWSVTTLLLTISFMLVQGVLLGVLMILSAVVALLSALVDMVDDKPSVPTPRRDRPGSPPSRGKPRSTAAVPPCTNTGKPIDSCGCSRRHVATADGAKRYGRAIGAPMGGRGPSKPSTTKKAGA